jgi:DMSO/TMAO reductase YedYZ molybdopterin-dependent catalytic subunit
MTRVTRPLDAETPIEAFANPLTPNDQFFVRSHFGPPAVERGAESQWRLRIAGEVGRVLTLTRKDLMAFEPVTVTAVLQCSGNGRAFYRPRTPGVQWQKGAVGNARWTGVRLADVLARAGLRAGARHVAFLGADRPVHADTPLFIRSIPIEKALHLDTLLAYAMNGEPLPLLHGAPLRVITPGWMADACTKWLSDITVLEHEVKGYFMETAYRHPVHPVSPGESISPADMQPVTTMPVKSLIVHPVESAAWPMGGGMVRGVAWSGDGRRIAKVELSTDEGRSWDSARLVGEDTRYGWRQWVFEWNPPRPGTYVILSRATDDHGDSQPLRSQWNPSGFLWNGVDRVSVSVAGQG